MIKSLPWDRLECPENCLGNAGPEILKSNNKNQLKIKTTQNFSKMKLNFIRVTKVYLFPKHFQ